jgi:uncharacterized protein
MLRSPAHSDPPRSRSRTVLLYGFAILLIVYSVLLTLVWSQQERVVFQPPRVNSGAPLDVVPGVQIQRVTYKSNDGIDLVGFVVGDPRAPSGLIIAFHGNADLARNLIHWAGALAHATGQTVFLPELRGYDGLAGRPTYEGAARDAAAAAAFARDSLVIPPGRIAYYGHSLGSALAVELASDRPPHVLLLESPFSSARAMAKRMFVPGLSLFWSILSRVHYDTVRRVSFLQVPVWVSHGDRDVIIPARMGRAVFEAAAVKGEFLIVRGAGHNDVAERGGEAYWDWFRKALRN